MTIKTQKQALKALDEIEWYLESHWQDGLGVILPQNDIESIEDMAENICSTCRRMSRLSKPKSTEVKT